MSGATPSGSFRRSSFAQQSGASNSLVQSFVDPSVSRPVELRLETVPPEDRPPSFFFGAVVILVALYFDTSVALWNQQYKGVQRAGDGEACEALWGRVEEGLAYNFEPPPPECRLEEGAPVDVAAIDRLLDCLRSAEHCSNIRTAVLAAVAHNPQLNIFGEEVCDSLAMEKVHCGTLVGNVTARNGYELRYSIEPESLRSRKWADLCPRRCSACLSPATQVVSRPAPPRPRAAVAVRRLAARSVEEVAMMRWPSGNWQAALQGPGHVSMVRMSAEDAEPGQRYFDASLQHPDCPWYLVQVNESRRGDFKWKQKEQELCGLSAVDKETCEDRDICEWHDKGRVQSAEKRGCYFKECKAIEGGVCYERRIHTYHKGASLFLQAVIGLMLYWGFAYYVGGMRLLRTCFDLVKMRKFAVVGLMFGFSSVFAFLAQENLTPGSYMIMGQTSILVVPTMWRFIFRTPIPSLTWLHISMTAFGIIMYQLADMDGDGGDKKDNFLGVVFIFFKVLMNGTAAVLSELFLKTQGDIPFVVQVTYVLPFKALACLSTVVILPPHRLPPTDIRPGWATHDWSIFVVFVIFHSLGDTVTSALVTKVFDSVVKAILGVIGIIFPTWIVSYMIGWESVDFDTSQGKLKVSGALIVVAAAFAYVLGRAQAKELSTKIDQVIELTREAGVPTVASTVSKESPVRPRPESAGITVRGGHGANGGADPAGGDAGHMRNRLLPPTSEGSQQTSPA